MPIQLPSGEPVGAWEEALALADLVPGAPGDGAWVAVQASGPRWTLQVRDRSGAMRTTTLDAPTTEEDREALVFLAKSLLTPIETGPLEQPVVIAAPEPLAPTQHPEPAVVPAARPRPSPQPQPYVPPPAVPVPRIEPAKAAPARPEPASPPPPAPIAKARPERGLPVWLEIDGLLAARPMTRPALTGGGALGLHFGRWDIGLRGAASTAEKLGALGPDRAMADSALGAKVARRAGPWRAGITAGAALRGFREGGAAIARAWVPQAGAELGCGFGTTVVLEPLVSVTGDLRLADLRVNGEVVRTVFPLRGAAGLRIVLRSADGE